MSMDHDYARGKLAVLLRDLDRYTADEFWREMSRIASGATGQSHAEELIRLATRRGEQRDALAADVGRLQKSLEAAERERDEWQRIAHTHHECEEHLAARLAEKQAVAFREVASWVDRESDAFGGPTHHEAEMIGMAISGPTGCSSVPNCMRAGRNAFLEAARIFDYRRHAEETRS